MIEITEAAATIIKRSLVEGKVIRMFLAAIDSTGANYGLALGDKEADDLVFESRGVNIYMGPKDAELLGETIIDYVDDDRGTGFIIGGPEDDLSVVTPAAMPIAVNMIMTIATMTTALADMVEAVAATSLLASLFGENVSRSFVSFSRLICQKIHGFAWTPSQLLRIVLWLSCYPCY